MRELKDYTTEELEIEIVKRNQEVHIVVIPIGIDVRFMYGIDINENIDSLRALNYNSRDKDHDAHKLGFKCYVGKRGDLLK